MMEEAREWNKRVIPSYSDFEKAFDSVDRDILWNIFKYDGVPDKLVNMIIALYEDSEYCVRIENGDMGFFKHIVWCQTRMCPIPVYVRHCSGLYSTAVIRHWSED